ncbi:flagellar biosynthetic protein FliO [Cobetia amphilecti]|uniref:flagellar biosynthetic protein FliO n=1 Tax=Cobetia amphilecti TaxID=1055104 RepID=UPI001C0A45A1|nr:flagellar biosynthetic protein FliO [Cobetia amphilecti]MBU3008258.1 flagellar biosynthetic protein FliO [Cobetia amphilecti]
MTSDAPDGAILLPDAETAPYSAANASSNVSANTNTSATTQAPSPAFLGSDANLTADTGHSSLLGAASLVNTGLALAGVIGVILLLAWLMKTLGGAQTLRGNRIALRPLARLALGHKQSLVVVAVGNQQLLLGVGPAGITSLGELTAENGGLLPADAGSTPNNASLASPASPTGGSGAAAGFAELLRDRLARRSSAATTPSDVTQTTTSDKTDDAEPRS